MKKRAISFLLVLCMLLSLVPISAQAAESTATAETAEQLSGFTDLYVKTGLKALFVAYGKNNATVDTAAGKWYGYTVRDGELVRDDTVYATIGGTDWSTQNGLGYADASFNHLDNKLVFPASLVEGNFAVDAVLKTVLRDIPIVEDTAETISTPTANADGTVSYVVTRYTKWNSTGADGAAITITFRGTAGTVFTPVLMGGNGSKDDMHVAVSAEALTIGADGTVQATYKYANKKLSVTVPSGVSVEAVRAYKYTDAYQAQAPRGFVFGNLYACTWTNKQGTNTYNNGKGLVRWNFGTSDWSVHNGSSAQDGIAYFGSLVKDNYDAADYDDSIVTMSVARNEQRYTVSFGAKIYEKDLAATYSADQLANLEGTSALELLNRMQGTVYAVRVYDAPLNDAAKKINHAADVLQFVGASLKDFNALGAKERTVCIEKLATMSLESATLDSVEKIFSSLIVDPAKTAQNAYDALYVGADGRKTANGASLVGLFTAFGKDEKSLELEQGSWYNKIAGGEHATVLGNDWVTYRNGGFGFDALASQIVADGLKMTSYNDNSISFSNAYAAFDNFTVEHLSRYRAPINADGVRASAEELKNAGGSAFGGHTANISAFRYGVLSFVGFYGYTNNGFHMRVQVAKGGWNSSYGQQTAEASVFGNDYYIKNRHDELLWTTVTKVTSSDGVTYTNYYGDTPSITGTVDAAKHATITALTPTDAASRFSMFNGAPGTVYAVRIYDGALTDKEKTHNRAVDIMAYCGADAEAYAAIESAAIREMVDATIVELGLAEDTDALRTEINDVIRNLESMLEQLEQGKAFNEYDALYVGANGEDTAEGGKLLALYSAMGPSLHSADTAGGLWYNKLDDQQYTATIIGPWQKNTAGGISASYTAGTFDANTLLTGISLPEEFADLSDFYLEGLVTYSLLEDSTSTVYNKGYSTFQIDIYSASWFNGKTGSMRAYLSRASWGEHNGRMSASVYTVGGVTGKGYVGNGSSIPTNLVTLQTFQKQTKGNEVFFEMLFDGRAYTTSPYYDDTDGDGANESFSNTSTATISKDAYNAIKEATVKNTAGRFSLMNGTPGSVYSVRVYTAPLTTAEQQRNAIADRIAFYQISVVDYLALSDEGRRLIDEQILSLGFDGDIDETRATIDEQIATVEKLLEATEEGNDPTDYDKLYVGANGKDTAGGGKLLALYTAYTKSDPSVSFTYNKWFNKMAGGPSADILGGSYSRDNANGWQYLKNGGFGYSDPDFEAQDTMLRLDKNLLSRDNFTVEVVAAPYMRDIPSFYEELSATVTDNGNGTVTYAFTPTSNWSPQQTAEVTFTGAAGTTFTPIYTYFDQVTVDGVKEWQPVNPVAATLTVGADGSVSSSFVYKRNGGITVTVPSGVTVSRLAVPFAAKEYEANANSSFVFGSFFAMTWTNMQGSNIYGNGYGTTRWYVGTQPWTGSGIQYKDATVFPSCEGQASLLTVTKSTTGAGIVHSASIGGVTVTMAALAPDKMPTADYGFQLFHNMSGDVYAVRVYDGALTTAETNYNHMIDLLAHAKADLSLFTSLDTTTQGIVADMLAGTALTSDTAEFNAMLSGILKELQAEAGDADNYFYVADGLVALYAAFVDFNSGYVASPAGITWINLINRAESASLYGRGWFTADNEKGGFSIERTYSEYNKDKDFGIRFDYDQLPDDDYTVEITVNPVGIHDVDEDGNRIRYIDDHSQYGTYADYGFVLGPLRTMSYNSYRPTGPDACLEKRWLYMSEGCWHAWGAAYSYSPAVKDNSWSDLAYDEIVNFAITMDEEGTSSVYSFIQNGELFDGYAVPNGKVQFLDKEDALDRRFELLNHLAGTVYAVRIYNRALTETELLQNRIADIIYYYDLDTTLFELAAGDMEDKSVVYQALSVLDYGMSREEAQKVFDSRLSAIWLTYGGVAAQTDGTDTLRYYFDLNMTGVHNMLASGYQIDIGAIVNLQRGKAPELTNGAYDFRISAFTDRAGCVQGFFVDEDTFCVTVVYEDADIATCLSDIWVRGYVHMTSADGQELLFYVDPVDGQADLYSLFGVYNYLLKTLDLIDYPEVRDFLETRIADSYQQEVIWVDADAVSGGDGSEATPYRDFAEAMDALKTKLRDMQTPLDVRIRLKDGTYPVYEVQTLSSEDIPYEFYSITIEAENEAGATLTTTVDMDTAGFRPVAGKENIYKYQFSPDASGKFPAFRYLYIDGIMGQAAAEGSTTARNEDQTFNKYERTVDGIYETVKALYLISPDVLRDEPNPYPASRPSLRAAYEKYKADFLAYDTYIKNPIGAIAVADPTAAEYVDAVGAATMAEGKIYLPESLVGGFADYVEERLAALPEGAFNEAETYRTVLKDVGVLMHIVAQWNYNIMHVVGIDYDDYLINEEDETVHYACYMKLEEYANYSIPDGYKFANRPVFLTDSLDFMDEEGEFYYDEVSGAVYYYTEGNIGEHEFAYPTMDNLLVLDGMQNLTLWGLHLTGVDDYYLTANGLAGTQSGGDKRTDGFPTRAAIYVKNGSRNMSIDSCVIDEVGCEGITVRGRAENLSIVYNTVHHTGASGIRVADKTKAFNEKYGLDGVTISENHLSEISYVYRTASALHLGSARDLVVSNNTIHDCAYTGISIGWNWSQVSWAGEIVGEAPNVNLYNVDIYGNYIYDFMTEMADGGAIYMLGGNAVNSYAELFNFIHDNYIVFTENAGNGIGGMVCGIYFDGSSSNWHCSSNIVVEQSKAADIEGTPAYQRRKGTTFIYVQHISSQLTYNILLENNIALNVRATVTDPPYNNQITRQELEIYKTYIVATRNIVERGTRYLNGVNNIPAAVEALISSAGCWQEMGDVSLLRGNDY